MRAIAWLPGLQLLRQYRVAWLPHDLMAGLLQELREAGVELQPLGATAAGDSRSSPAE